MQFAERMAFIQPSMTLAINTRAQELKAQGVDVINLAAGEPDFPTPEFVKEAAKKAIDDNFTHYTPVVGMPALREAAGRYFERCYKTPVPAESIITGAGGKACLYTFMQAMLNPGDEVLIPAPYWVSYPDMAKLAGATPVTVPASAANGFKVTPMQLENKTTEKTKLLVLNSPGNPTGAVYSDREFMNIMRWALARNIFVISDEIYDQIIYPPAVMTSAITWFEHCPELVAVVNGLSKSFAMTGWRVGFLAGHPDLIKKMAMLQGHIMSNICSVAQKAAIAALTGQIDCVESMRQAFERRRDMAMAIVNGFNNVICPKPDGAFYLFMDVSAYYNGEVSDSVAFCKYMLEKAHIGIVPGAAFGDDRCIRISYSIADQALKTALERMGEALGKLAS